MSTESNNNNNNNNNQIYIAPFALCSLVLLVSCVLGQYNGVLREAVFN